MRGEGSRRAALPFLERNGNLLLPAKSGGIINSGGCSGGNFSMSPFSSKGKNDHPNGRGCALFGGGVGCWQGMGGEQQGANCLHGIISAGS